MALLRHIADSTPCCGLCLAAQQVKNDGAMALLRHIADSTPCCPCLQVPHCRAELAPDNARYAFRGCVQEGSSASTCCAALRLYRCITHSPVELQDQHPVGCTRQTPG